MKKYLWLALVVVGCNNAASVEQPQEYAGDCASHTDKYVLKDQASVWHYDTVTVQEFVNRLGTPTNHKLRDSSETTFFTIRTRLGSLRGELGDGEGELGMLELHFSGHKAYVPIPACENTQLSPYLNSYQGVTDSIRAWYGWPAPNEIIQVPNDSVELTGVGVSTLGGSSYTWTLAPIISIKRF